MITYKELSTLTKELGFSASALYLASNKNHYHAAKIPKSNGKARELSIPDNFLKAIQRKISNKILCYSEISPYAAAYGFGCSTIKNAAVHFAQPMILKLDIRHFFDSITYSIVKETVFPSEQFSEGNRVLLTLLCTHNGCLPQGAPTSPIISNIVMKEFDNDVGLWCNQRNIKYTRYCDDMTFSGHLSTNEIISFITPKLKGMGFILNTKKTKLACDGQRKAVTGIVVNEKINVPINYRKSLRQEMYYCRKYGVDSHIKHIGENKDKTAYLKSLLGKINYILSVDSENTEVAQYKTWILNKLNSNK